MKVQGIICFYLSVVYFAKTNLNLISQTRPERIDLTEFFSFSAGERIAINPSLYCGAWCCTYGEVSGSCIWEGSLFGCKGGVFVNKCSHFTAPLLEKRIN